MDIDQEVVDLNNRDSDGVRDRLGPGGVFSRIEKGEKRTGTVIRGEKDRVTTHTHTHTHAGRGDDAQNSKSPTIATELIVVKGKGACPPVPSEGSAVASVIVPLAQVEIEKEEKVKLSSADPNNKEYGYDHEYDSSSATNLVGQDHDPGYTFYDHDNDAHGIHIHRDRAASGNGGNRNIGELEARGDSLDGGNSISINQKDYDYPQRIHLEESDLDPAQRIPFPTNKEEHGLAGGQRSRSRRISIDDLLSGPVSTSRISRTTSNSSTPSISPATPEDFPRSLNTSAYHRLGSIHSPVPLPLPRSRSSTTARPISHRRPGPISTSSHRARASPYLTSAARFDATQSSGSSPASGLGIGLGINMINTPSTPGHSPHSHGPSPALQSPGSMSARRRKAPEWPLPKSARSHSFGATHGIPTPRDMYQTLKTPAALRVPTTASLLSHAPGYSPAVPIASTSGPGPVRRGLPPSSAPPLSAHRIESPQIPPTPRRVHLLDVPRAKVISTLNERAGKYWFDLDSSDCRVYVPIPRKKAGPSSPQIQGESSDITRSWPPVPDCPKHVEGLNGDERNVVNTHGYYKSRRGSMPNEQEVPILVFHVHRDYLVTQSNLLRSLLTATSPTRPTFPQSPTTPQARSFPASTPTVLRMPKEKTIRGARILPQREGEPVSIYMPIPDPASFGIVLHWLYWGDTPTIERALSQGLASWQGVVKNIEYLGLDDSIKRVIGKWWRTWVKTDVGRQSQSQVNDDRRPSASDSEVSKRKNGARVGRDISVESDSTSATDGEREEDGMEVDVKDGDRGGKEVDDGGVGDLFKKL